MRGASSLGVLLCAGIVGISSAALTAIDIVSASANSWDTRTALEGCAPDSCIPSNAIDGSVEYDSRWSCQRRYDDEFEACELTLEFGEPRDITEIRLALWRGNERTRLINVLADGVIVTTIESSGTTEGYVPYHVTATQASTIVLQAAGSNDEAYNGWLSILDIEIMVETDIVVSSPSPAPTDDSYVGCFNDDIDDRIMSTGMIMDDLTSEACSAACRDVDRLYYALQQGNECWCAGCDLTDGDTNTVYDRHGSGSCSAACAGDSSSECGGDLSFSLFLTGNCGPTPAPTVATLVTDCPTESTPFALQITLVYPTDPDTFTLWFQVNEPDGGGPYIASGLGDYGVVTVSSDETVITYTTMNGLSDGTSVLGDYEIDLYGPYSDVAYALTARVAGEIVLEAQARTVSGEDTTYIVTVAEYAESDCKIEGIGVCPGDTFSSDGTPPCSECTEARTSEVGATTCDVAAFEEFEVTDEVAAAMLADAVGGFIGPLRFSNLAGHGRSYGDWDIDTIYYEVTAEDEGTLRLTGTTFVYAGYLSTVPPTFPPSTELMVYVDSEGAENLILGQGTLDSSTGEFSITVEDLPIGKATAYFSFSVLDPDQSPKYFGPGAVFYTTAINTDCTSPLSIKLDYEGGYSTTSFILRVQEPDGTVVDPGQSGRVGFSSTSAYGSDAMGYKVTGGDASASGVYTARVYPNVFEDVAFTLTAEVDGETVWVEEGIYYGAEITSRSYSGWDETPSPFGDFFVTLDSVLAC